MELSAAGYCDRMLIYIHESSVCNSGMIEICW